MALDWRDSLRTLLMQFEARAAKSAGLNHLLVEVVDHERTKMLGPSWFAPYSRQVQVVDGKPKYDKWNASASGGLPGVSPGYRAAKPDETFDESAPHRLIRDRSGSYAMLRFQ